MISYLDGLKFGEYVDLGDSWIVCLRDPLKPYINYDINGREFGSKQIIVSPNSIIKSIKVNGKKAVRYEDINGKVIPLDEYYKVMKENHHKYEDEDGDLMYPSLEVEYECKKNLLKLKNCTCIYENIPNELTDVTLKCVGTACDTGSKYIETALQYGESGFTNSNFFKVDLSGIFSNTVLKFIRDNDLSVGFSNDHKDTVRYAKYNGNYLFSSSDIYADKGKVCYFNTLKESVEKEQTVRKNTLSLLNIQIFNNELNPRSIKNILVKLESIRHSVNNINPRSQSYKSHTKALTDLKSLRDLLMSEDVL